MERGRTSEPGRTRAVRGFRAWLLSGASMAVLLGAGPALAQVPADETLGPERVYRAEALAHAGAVEAAWRRLETFILRDSRGAASWPGAVPPASTGWQASWTQRGVEARYCGDTLLVYLAPDELKGVGRDHRAVHAAPHAYGGGERPVLHWLEGGAARGGAGRAAVTLPACLSAAARGGPLPSGRAALAGTVRDPFLHTAERVDRERRVEPCPAGTHGEGRTLVREVTRTENGRGDPVGAPAEGPWEVLIDLCRDDYSRWEHYTLACHWDAGPPHNRRMEGREVWRRLRTVTAAGETLGPPEFVSTSCWTGDALPPPPTPEISETPRQETKSGSCPAGYTGSIGYERTVTLQGDPLPLGRGAGDADDLRRLDGGARRLRGGAGAGQGARRPRTRRRRPRRRPERAGRRQLRPGPRPARPRAETPAAPTGSAASGTAAATEAGAATEAAAS